MRIRFPRLGRTPTEPVIDEVDEDVTDATGRRIRGNSREALDMGYREVFEYGDEVLAGWRSWQDCVALAKESQADRSDVEYLEGVYNTHWFRFYSSLREYALDYHRRNVLPGSAPAMSSHASWREVYAQYTSIERHTHRSGQPIAVAYQGLGGWAPVVAVCDYWIERLTDGLEVIEVEDQPTMGDPITLTTMVLLVVVGALVVGTVMAIAYSINRTRVMREVLGPQLDLTEEVRTRYLAAIDAGDWATARRLGREYRLLTEGMNDALSPPGFFGGVGDTLKKGLLVVFVGGVAWAALKLKRRRT